MSAENGDGANEPNVTLEEIALLVRDFPGPDQESATTAVAHERDLAKPRQALGRLEELAEWLATWQGRHPPRIERPNVSVFAGNHGIVAKGVAAFPSEVTGAMVKTFAEGGGAINQISAALDADFRVFELALEVPTKDFTEAPAMTDKDCARAMAYGMMAVEQGVDVIALGEMGIGNTTTAAALCAALFGGAGADWVGPGAGADPEQMQRKRDAVDAGLALHKDEITGPLDALRRLGGYEFAGICGAIIAARMGRVPVVLDGFVATAAAAVIAKLAPGGLDHCIVGHLSREPGHAKVCEHLGKQPVLDLGMALGEATGAALAIHILRAAALCHSDMATLSDVLKKAGPQA
jgi:nicotinate-nucleotide--dimethylbenzimidazole phosphoribosyltransferase